MGLYYNYTTLQSKKMQPVLYLIFNIIPTDQTSFIVFFILYCNIHLMLHVATSHLALWTSC